jgi:hypothetical protein
MRSLVVFGSDHCRDCGTREIARVVHGAAVSERYALLQSATVALEPIASTTTRGGKRSRRTERGIRSSTRRCCPSPPLMATTTPAGAMRWENPTFVASCFPAWHPSLCAGFCLNSPYRSFPLARSGPYRRSLSCAIGAEGRTPLSCRSRRAVVAKRSRSPRTPCSLCVRCEGCYDYVVRPEQRQWPGRQRHGAPRSGVCRRAAGRGHFVA